MDQQIMFSGTKISKPPFDTATAPRAELPIQVKAVLMDLLTAVVPFFLLLVSHLPCHAVLGQDLTTLQIGQYEPIPAPYHPLTLRGKDANQRISGFLHRPIVYADPYWEWICNFCTKPAQPNTAKKENRKRRKKTTRVTWTLKSAARWGDGTPITGKDVLFSWLVGRTMAESGYEVSEIYKKISNIDPSAKDKKQFTVEWKDYQMGAFRIHELILLPAHLERSIWKKSKGSVKKYLKNTNYLTAPALPGLYTGPFVPLKWKGGSKTLELIPNTHFPTEIKNRITVKQIKGWSLKKLAGVDLIFSQKLNKAPKEHFILHRASPYLEQITFNLRNPILNNQLVRKAVFNAIDYERVIQSVSKSMTPLTATSFVTLENPHFSAAAQFPRANPDKAREYLDKSGWKMSSNSPYRSMDEKTLEFSISFPSGNKNRRIIAKVLADSLKKVGIKATLKPIKTKKFFEKTVPRIQFSGLALFSLYLPFEQNLGAWFHSKEIPKASNGYRGQNYSNWVHSEVDSALLTLNSKSDPTARREAIFLIQQKFREQIPSIPLFFSTSRIFVKKEIQNIVTPGHQFPMTFYSEYWKKSESLNSNTERVRTIGKTKRPPKTSDKG